MILIGALGLVACKMNQLEALQACMIITIIGLIKGAFGFLAALWSAIKSTGCKDLCSCGGMCATLIKFVMIALTYGLAFGLNIALCAIGWKYAYPDNAPTPKKS